MAGVLDEATHKESKRFDVLGKTIKKCKHIRGAWNVSQSDTGSRGQLRKLSNHALHLVAS